MSIRLPLLLLFVCLMALAAAAPLRIPYEPPGHALFGGGSSALWMGSPGPWFVVRTDSRSLQRSSFVPGGPWRGPVQWDARALLTTTAASERQIFTLHGEPGEAPATIPFVWASMPDSLRAVLGGEARGEAITNYLRGQALGDIVRSVPMIVGAPKARGFPERHAERGVVIYVGANDGMLHAFAAETGKELFAYIPRLLHAGLPALATPGTPPKVQADGSAASRDVLIGEQWRTVLASGLGMGARGLFLLDVTEPAAFGREGGALWEFGTADDDAIGHIHAPPLFARLPHHVTGEGWAGRPVAIVPSGINPEKEGAKGALFLMALDKPAGEPWERGRNYARIDTSGDAPTLSAPALVIGADGTATDAYAGDLDGNLWHFDLASQRSRRVFTARDATGRAQSIAHAPLIVHAPGGGYLVIFGTGKLLEEEDLLPDSFRHQSLYGIHDVPASGRSAIRSRSELAERILSGTSDYTISGEALDYLVPDAKRGWYADLPNGRSVGERVAASPVAEGGVVLFQTVAPGAAAGQTMRRYYINAIDGTALDGNATAKRDKRTGAVSKADPLQPLILIRGSGTESPPDPTGAITITHRIQESRRARTTPCHPSPSAARRGAWAGGKSPTGRTCTRRRASGVDSMRRQTGFTLAEILVVLAIVGILAAIAYPGYTSYLVKARRAEAQLALLTIMQQQENFHANHNTYVAFEGPPATPEARAFRWWSGDSPTRSAYEISAHACPDTPLQRCVELRATPGTARVNASFRDDECGILTLNSVGLHGASGPRKGCWP